MGAVSGAPLNPSFGVEWVDLWRSRPRLRVGLPLPHPSRSAFDFQPMPGIYNPAVQAAIREYRFSDFAELWQLDQECFEPGISYSRAELMHYIRRRGAFTLVAEQEKSAEHQIAGFVIAEREQTSLGHIITIDIGGKARRQGLGSRLMEAAEQRLAQLGCPAVYLETAVNNQAAIAFYKRLGYFIVKTIPRYYQNRLDALVMAKKLSAQQQRKFE